jgi:hypothetical protein
LFVERGVKFSIQTEALYYRILEAVINQERKRLRYKDLSVSPLPSAVYDWNCTV